VVGSAKDAAGTLMDCGDRGIFKGVVFAAGDFEMMGKVVSIRKPRFLASVTA
jgi:hypothetical protein